MKSIISWDNPVNAVRSELVFENRNKEFGAYLIRKKYENRFLRAFFFTVVFVALAIGIPSLVQFFANRVMESKTVVSDVLTLEAPPIDETPPPPPPEPPPPVQKTIQFTPPTVVEHIEEPPPTQEEVKETKVDVVTQKGEDIVEAPPESPVVDPDEGKVFTIVEEMPSFPGGEEKLLKYLSENIKYPAIARENGIMGVVYVTFVVDKDGKIKDTKILRGIGGGCDEEAMRVIKGMPQWKAGKQNGRAVQVQYNVPVRFSLK